MGFKLNEHDSFVANNMIYGKQCTIYWYFDNTKISYKDTTVVDKVISKIEDKVWKNDMHGEEHNFVGMDISVKENGTLQILMQEYMKESIAAFWRRDKERHEQAS